MPESNNLSNSQKDEIKEKLINIFKDICFNNPNILNAKSESDKISEEIRKFILGYLTKGKEFSEADLLLHAKKKGLELVENHNLIFFEETLKTKIKMKGFLIPGIKIESTEENSEEKVTEDDLQSVDHELCISFKYLNKNQFIKLGTLIDIRANLAKVLSNKKATDSSVENSISNNNIFKGCLESLYSSAKEVLT